MLQILGAIFGILTGRFVAEVIFKKNYSWSNIAVGLIGLGWLVFLLGRIIKVLFELYN